MVKNKLMGNVKSTIGLGIGSMTGLGAMGAMGNIPGMPKESGVVTNITGSGIALANVGQLAKTGLNIMPSSKSYKHKSSHGKIDKALKKMLYKK